MPDKDSASAFTDLLRRFAAAVVANDGAGLAALFAPDGVYADEFFGAHQGRAAIAAMLQRFHDTGRDYRWDFIDPVCGGGTGYARFRFSFASSLPESEGRPVVFEGISRFAFRDGLIARYDEAFDRGVALVQLGFPAERIKRILEKTAALQNATAEARGHLDRFSHHRNKGKQAMRSTFFVMLPLLIATSAGQAQSLQEIDKREAAIVEAWQKTPLTVRRAVFVSEHPAGFGQYAERKTSVFKPGESLVAYVEPVGYGWKDAGNGDYEFGLAVDFVLKTPDGKILAGQENFGKFLLKSHARNREFFATLTLDVTGAKAGDYVLEYKLRDLASDKSTTLSMPFKIGG